MSPTEGNRFEGEFSLSENELTAPGKLTDFLAAYPPNEADVLGISDCRPFCGKFLSQTRTSTDPAEEDGLGDFQLPHSMGWNDVFFVGVLDKIGNPAKEDERRRQFDN